MKRKYWAPLWAVVLVLCTTWVLFFFSGQSGPESNAVSSGFTEMILSVLHIELTATQLASFHVVVRKMAHFGLFFLLGLGLMGLFYKFSLKRGIPMTVALSVAVAAANEYHQLLGGTRTASIKDVCLDSGGAIAGCLSYCMLCALVRMWQSAAREKRRKYDS